MGEVVCCEVSTVWNQWVKRFRMQRAAATVLFCKSTRMSLLRLETKPRTFWNSWSAPNMQFQSYLCQATFFLFPFVYLPVSTSPWFVDTLSEFKGKGRARTWMCTCSEFIHALQAGFILFRQIMACLIWQSLLYIKAAYVMNLKAMPPLVDRLSGTFNRFSGLSNTLLNT